MKLMPVLTAALFVAQVGCIYNGSASKLAQGETVASGEERYDSFFRSVTDVKRRADDATGDEPFRKKIALAVGISEQAKLEETIDGARLQATELKRDGGRFFVVVSTEPKLIVRKGSEESKERAAFVQAIEDVIRDGTAKSEELWGVAQNATSLEEALPGLEADVAKAFEDPSTRREVSAELEAAKDILERARARAGLQAGRSLRFVVLLASAVDSGAAAELVAISASGAAKAPKPVVKGAWLGPAKGVPAQGQSGTKPKPKPRPKNDFDP